MRLGVHNYPAEAEEAGTSIGARFESDGERGNILFSLA